MTLSNLANTTVNSKVIYVNTGINNFRVDHDQLIDALIQWKENQTLSQGSHARKKLVSDYTLTMSP